MPGSYACSALLPICCLFARGLGNFAGLGTYFLCRCRCRDTQHLLGLQSNLDAGNLDRNPLADAGFDIVAEQLGQLAPVRVGQRQLVAAFPERGSCRARGHNGGNASGARPGAAARGAVQDRAGLSRRRLSEIQRGSP